MGAFLRGQLALERDDPESALPAFETAVAADPGTAILRVRLASLYVRAGKLEKALEQCNAAVQLEPENLEALTLLGGILSSLGRDDEAIASYERMRQINPALQDPYLYLSALYAKRGDTDRAVATLKELVERSPGSAATAVSKAGSAASGSSRSSASWPRRNAPMARASLVGSTRGPMTSDPGTPRGNRYRHPAHPLTRSIEAVRTAAQAKRRIDVGCPTMTNAPRERKPGAKPEISAVFVRPDAARPRAEGRPGWRRSRCVRRESAPASRWGRWSSDGR